MISYCGMQAMSSDPTGCGHRDDVVTGLDGGAPWPPGARYDQGPRRLTPFQAAVVAVVEGLQPGEVLTYVEVAAEAGHPGAAQAVANVLRRIEGLPWWRIIPSDHRLYCSHAPVQQPLLQAEGVVVDDDRRVHG